jgi:sec-independent protein translocase protein TatA
MIHFGTTELVILLVIVILLFGAGRISKIAKELGASVRTFREGVGGEKEKE